MGFSWWAKPPVSEILKEILRRDEGVRFKPYRDTVGKLTIGVGRNLDDKGLSPAEVEFMLDNDIAEVRSQAAAFHWFANLNAARQAVVLSMLFNLGFAGFLKFQRTIAAIESGRYADAATYMLESKWAGQVGQRAVRLAEMMRTGVV